MPYSRPYAGGFVDYPSTTTPINSTALNTMDVGIKTANDQFQTVTTAQRTALTPTVGQCVWDSDLRQLMVFMNASGGNAWQPIGNAIVCTSTTRPATPFEGQVIRETDTNKEFTYSGAAWVQTNTWGTTSGVTGVSNLIVPPSCRATNSSNVSVANNTLTNITFNTNTFDTDAIHSTSSNTERFICSTAGVYLFSLNVGWTSNATGDRGIYLVHSVAGTVAVHYVPTVTSAGGVLRTNLSAAYYMNANEYMYWQAYQTSGGSLNLLAESAVSSQPFNASAIWIGRTS